MGRTDVPASDELDALLRDLPRFELATLPEDINIKSWMFLGNHFARSRISNVLQKSIGQLLKQELRLYGNALSQWSSQFVSKMVLLVSSYTDAYRVQLQRINGTSEDTIDAPQLEQDLVLLKNWNTNHVPEASKIIEREA
jgi:hypothetical protein